MTRVAAIQMNSGARVADNLALARQLLEEAAADGCELAVLPENFALMAKHAGTKVDCAEVPGDGPIQAFLAETAQRLGLWIIGGSIPLASPDPGRVYGATFAIDAEGKTRAIYRKIHLFDVDLNAAGESYRESASMFPGDALEHLETPAGVMGLTICYDLRFPEMFRRLVDAGASLFAVPAAFTAVTGEAHWHCLLRARAIENLAYVIAPGQFGTHADGRATYGHSLIVDPWGKVLAERASGNGVVAAELDPALPAQLRAEFPALSNRRLS